MSDLGTVRGHEYYEQLSALAAMGELSPAELIELEQHASDCRPCAVASAEFSHIVHAELPALHAERTPWLARFMNLFTRKRSEQRFIDRAKTHGFRFSPEVERGAGGGRLLPAPRAWFALVPSLALIIVAAAIITLELHKNRTFAVVSPEVQRQAADLAQQQELQSKLQQQTIEEDAHWIAILESRLAASQGALKIASQRVAAAEQQRDKLARGNETLKSSVEAERANSADLAGKLRESDKKLVEASDSAQKLESNHNADLVVIANQQKQLDDLTADIKAQNEVLGQERQLLSAGRDIRDMMGARNLHIIDVFDADMSGSNRRAFGRVFYTEGKSLVFYAFDLSGGASVVNAKHSFQAWGLRDGVKDSAKSLGIFYVDDAAQKRWVLKVEDPMVLKQIDSVFVTVEPFGGAEKPSTHKLLYAFMRNQPNHP
jgi:hypothetical protein